MFLKKSLAQNVEGSCQENFVLGAPGAMVTFATPGFHERNYPNDQNCEYTIETNPVRDWDWYLVCMIAAKCRKVLLFLIFSMSSDVKTKNLKVVEDHSLWFIEHQLFLTFNYNFWSPKRVSADCLLNVYGHWTRTTKLPFWLHWSLRWFKYDTSRCHKNVWNRLARASLLRDKLYQGISTQTSSQIMIS